MMRAASVLALSLVLACGSDSTDAHDAQPHDASAADATSTDGSPTDGALTTDGRPLPDADPAACVPANIWQVVADRALEVGDFCDDIKLCAKDAGVAAQIMGIESGFTCSDAPGDAGCATGERSCVWHTPDVVDATDYANLCAITVLSDAPTRLSCYVYL